MTTLLYFAEKGYLSIEEYAEEKYKFVKQRDIPEGEEWQYAGDLFRRLFRDHEKVRTHKLSQSFREMVVVCTHTLKIEYDRKYGSPVKASSRTAQVFAIVVIGLLSFVGFLIGPAFTVPGVLLVYTGYENKRTIGKGSGMVIFGTILYIIGALLTGVSVGSIFTISPFGYAVFGLMLVMGFFAVIMPGRNEENTKLLGEILGFREFIETAEYDRLKELSDENPQYFYHILPYATVLGMETKWANKFVNIPVVKPEWYITYHNRPFFYDERWTRDFMHDTITSSLPSPPASESSGGWSGGGGAW